MIPDYINKWLKIIEEMQNDNTYKLAFARALIENIANARYEVVDDKVVVDFDDIAVCMLKYYWNQLFYFKLKQAPYLTKEPVICQDTQKLIELYKRLAQTTIPKWFDEAIIEIRTQAPVEYAKRR